MQAGVRRRGGRGGRGLPERCSGLISSVLANEEMLPEVKRGLRERGITSLQTFLFQAPLVSRPSFLITFSSTSATFTAEAPVIPACSEMIRYLNADAGYEEVYALILKDTPTVLSMGIAVIDNGWHFEWPARSFAPFAIRPE